MFRSTSGAAVEIEDIRYRVPVEPQDVAPRLRTVSEEVRADGPGTGWARHTNKN